MLLKICMSVSITDDSNFIVTINMTTTNTMSMTISISANVSMNESEYCETQYGYNNHKMFLL